MMGVTTTGHTAQQQPPEAGVAGGWAWMSTVSGLASREISFFRISCTSARAAGSMPMLSLADVSYLRQERAGQVSHKGGA